MDSEKVTDIKKALECCCILTNKDLSMETRDNACYSCPYGDMESCWPVLVEKSLTLINELESENERLNKALVDNKLKTENRQFKDRIAELEKGNANLLQVINDLENIDTKLQNTCAICEAELKQFAEMLRGKAIRRQEFIGELAIDDVEYVKIQDVDETLKEFINGKV